jgi:hypothetical protein
MKFKTFGEDPRTRDQRLADLLESFRRAEAELRHLDTETGDNEFSDRTNEVIQSVKEGLAQALMSVVMDLSSDEQKNA